MKDHDEAPVSPPQQSKLRLRLRHITSALLWFMLWVLVLYTLMLWWWDRPYWLDLASHFAVHVGYAWTFMTMLVLCSKRRRFALLLCIAVIAHWASVWQIARSTSMHSLQKPVWQQPLRIVSFNAFGKRIDQDEGFRDWLTEIEPDVICIIESPWGVASRIDPDATVYPYRVQPSAGLEWSIEILSRVPFTLPQLAPRTQQSMFSFIRARSPLLEFENGEKVLLGVIHPVSPRTKSLWQQGTTMLEEAGTMLRTFSESTSIPVIAVGDFNTTPFGVGHRTFAQASGLRASNNVLTGGTWPASIPAWISLPIDRVWISEQMPPPRVTTHRMAGSDHRVLLVEF